MSRHYDDMSPEEIAIGNMEENLIEKLNNIEKILKIQFEHTERIEQMLGIRSLGKEKTIIVR